MKNEEGSINELSKGLLKRYSKKVEKPMMRSWDKAAKEEDKAMSTDGDKHPEKQARHSAAAGDAIKKWKKHSSGQALAALKIKKNPMSRVHATEEVGMTKDINELSNKTLASYMHKSSERNARREKEEAERSAKHSNAMDGISQARNSTHLDRESDDLLYKAKERLHGNDAKARDKHWSKSWIARKSMDRAERRIGGETAADRNKAKADREAAHRARQEEEAKKAAKKAANAAKKASKNEEVDMEDEVMNDQVSVTSAVVSEDPTQIADVFNRAVRAKIDSMLFPQAEQDNDESSDEESDD